MIHKFNKDIVCSDSFDCSKQLVDKFETLGLILMSRNKGDIVNGSVSISHIQNDHEINIEIYEKNEKPNNKHFGDFKKPLNTITKKQLEDKI